ncbi:MAG: Uma2 family endonuclease [Deltaproteobacteria bacterium]|nr:Uma2 family endonuclease [Deltaproteobacteria bacterium]
MAIPAENSTERFSWNEYKDWPEDERWQIIDGQAYCMTAAPNIRHQKITGNLYVSIREKLKGKLCMTFIAPTDVVFDDHNIVQPDVLVVCDKNKITDANIQGTPDLVIEVISPSNSFMDKKMKLELYERFTVPEYLLVDPVGDLVECYRLVDGKYGRAEIFPWYEKLPLMSLSGIELSLWEVFERDLAELNVVKEGPKSYRVQ